MNPDVARRIGQLVGLIILHYGAKGAQRILESFAGHGEAQPDVHFDPSYDPTSDCDADPFPEERC